MLSVGIDLTVHIHILPQHLNKHVQIRPQGAVPETDTFVCRAVLTSTVRFKSVELH